MRNWSFQASVNKGGPWDTLCKHREDLSLQPNSERAGWHVEGCDKFYSYFRVHMEHGGNDQGTYALVISCFELFGDLKRKPDLQAAASSHVVKRKAPEPSGATAPERALKVIRKVCPVRAGGGGAVKR